MFEILAILASSEESASSIKAAAESYIEILDQHEVKVASQSTHLLICPILRPSTCT
jgi:hypothetical protein